MFLLKRRRRKLKVLLKSERAKKEKTNNYFQKFNLIQLARAEEITHTHSHAANVLRWIRRI